MTPNEISQPVLDELNRPAAPVTVLSVRTTPLLGATPDAGWSRGTDRNLNLYTLIEVETSDGISGIGSAFTSTALVNAALEVLDPLLIGENALEPERVTEKLLQASYWFGRGGAVTTTIAAIDIALWDILGKAFGQPVSRLLGGCYRNRVRPYASMLFADPPILRDRLHSAVEQGYRAIKLGWGGFGRDSARYDELLVKTARETVGGDIDLFVDAGGADEFWPHQYKWALRTSQMLSEWDIGWFEEPLSPDDLDGLKTLRDHSPVPIATGEALTRRQSFLPLIDARAVDIVQPDTTKVGGLSEARKIGWAAYDHGVAMVSHGWNTAVGVAADLALAAALPTTRLVEYQTDSLYIDGIVERPFKLDDEGYLPVPTAPGLGIELDAEKVERLSRLPALT